MRDFFKPWRRKIGVVTLVMACVFAAAWIRGLAGRARFVIPGKLGIEYVAETNPIGFSLSKDVYTVVGLRSLYGEPILAIRAPHWSVAIPFTLLSAYLLLSKPRQKNPPEDTFHSVFTPKNF